MDFLFRNRWAAMLLCVLLVAGLFGFASRSITAPPAPKAAPSEDAHASFARWAAEDQPPASEDPDQSGQKRYEVRVYDHGRDVTSQVGDLPNGAEQTAPIDAPPQ